jgi:hypothetical protein
MLHAFLFLLLATAQGGPLHAGLHPAETDVYIEVADVSALLPELERAPLVRFLRDERISSLLTELGHPANRPLKELASEGLATAFPGAQPEGWLAGLKTVSASLVVIGKGAEGTPRFGFLGVLDLATPADAAALRAVLVELAPEHEPMSAALQGVELLHMGEEPAKDVWCVVVGSRLVFGNVASKVDDYAARADQGSAGLARNERFQAQLGALDESSGTGRQRVDAHLAGAKQPGALDEAKGTPVLWFALARSIQEIFAVVQETEDEGMKFLDRLPADLNPLGSARVARMQFVGERFVTEVVSSEVPGESASRPVDPSWLEPVPPGSMIVYSSAFDGAAAGRRARALLAGDEQSAASLAALEQKLGFGPERVLARLGPGLTVYMAAPAGIGLPETRAWIDCEDPAAFAGDFEALVGALGETLPGFAAKTKPYKVKKSGSEEKIEVPITTLTLPPDLVQIPMISLAPSFAPVGKKLVFGLASMDVKSELKRVHSGDGEPIVAGSDPLIALGFQLPAEARSVFVMDWAKLFASIVGSMKMIAGMADAQSLPFDFAKLPPPEMFAQYFEPTFHYSQGASAGRYCRNEASFGPETWSAIAAGSRAMMSGPLGRARDAKQRADEAGREEEALRAKEGQTPPGEPHGGGR